MSKAVFFTLGLILLSAAQCSVDVAAVADELLARNDFMVPESFKMVLIRPLSSSSFNFKKLALPVPVSKVQIVGELLRAFHGEKTLMTHSKALKNNFHSVSISIEHRDVQTVSPPTLRLINSTFLLMTPPSVHPYHIDQCFSYSCYEF